MAELKGSRTEQNLKQAFAGESKARNKYTYFASVAKKEGYEQIAAIFLETADQEKEHAKLHLKLLEGIGDTAANLQERVSPASLGIWTRRTQLLGSDPPSHSMVEFWTGPSTNQ